MFRINRTQAWPEQTVYSSSISICWGEIKAWHPLFTRFGRKRRKSVHRTQEEPSEHLCPLATFTWFGEIKDPSTKRCSGNTYIETDTGKNSPSRSPLYCENDCCLEPLQLKTNCLTQVYGAVTASTTTSRRGRMPNETSQKSVLRQCGPRKHCSE